MIDELLQELQRRKIRLSAEDGRLKYQAPRGALTEELAERLREHKQALIERCNRNRGSRWEPIPVIARDGPQRLSFSQQRMWFLWKLEPNSTAYCVPIVLKISGPLDSGNLVRALELVRSRHETLRTRVVEISGRPYQEVKADEPLDFREEDLTAEEGPKAEATAGERIERQMEVPVDLTRSVPFEIRLFHVGNGVHYLLIRLHHINFDGWSNQLFMRELWPAYRSFAEGTDCDLPTLPIQYADFTAWQHKRFAGPLRDELLSYWINQLRGADGTLNLPTRSEAASSRGMQGDEVSFQIPGKLTSRLSKVGQKRRATMFMTLVVALRVLLSRYSGEPDILIGTPAIRRFHPDTEHLIGYFGNTLVLRNPLRPDDSYLVVLEREREVALGAYQNQEIPFDMVVDALAPTRGDGAAPLFQVMFLFGESAPAVYPVGDLRVEFLETSTTRAKFDLGLWIKQLPQGGMSGHFEYASSRFDRRAIERMSVHFQRILSAMATNPDSEVAATQVLTTQELDIVLREWNNDALPTGDLFIHEMFRARAEADPDAVAVIAGKDRITYGALDRRVRALAYRLQEGGVRPGDHVVVCLPRTPSLIASLLAVMQVGAAYVPIDPNYPAERLNFMLEDSTARYVISDSEQSERWVTAKPEILLVDTVEDDVAERSTDDLSWHSEDALAYVLYTSGSTGRPKGVEIEHRSAASLVRWALHAFAPDELAFVLAGTSVCFDLSVFELFVPLCGGYGVILAENPLELHSLPARDSVTLINTVPSVMRALLADSRRAFPESLRVVCLAGEPLSSDLVDEVYSRTPAAKVYDLYGPTEATTFATRKLRRPDQPATIGRPIANTRAYVLDASGMPVPIGVIGELYLAGDTLARGYLGRPELTAERFAPPLATCISESRLYRTGDLVRYTPGGELEYLGRCDDQLKILGHRIEPGEVRAALVAIEGVENALVVGRSDNAESPSLVAYVIGNPASTSPAHLRRSLSDNLPAYMIPSSFVRVESFPLGSTGKVDVARLTAAPVPETTADGQTFNETEEVIAGIWSDVLGKAVGPRDHFFEVGGNSMSAMLVVSRINDSFDTTLPLRALFDYETIQTLARHVDRSPRSIAPSPPVPANETADVPVTLLQRHLWLVHHTVDNPAFLNVWQTTPLVGCFDSAAAKRALGELVQNYSVLRARFPAENRRLHQAFGPVEIHLPVANLLDAQGHEEKQQRAGAFCFALGEPFDLQKGPCFRFGLILLSNQRQLLVMVFHHIVVDEWSLDCLAKEFLERYDAARRERLPPRKPEFKSFAEYALWEQHCRESGLFKEQIAWWTDHLKTPLAQLTFDGFEENSTSATHGFDISLELWERLATIASREHTSMFAILLAMLKLLLHRRTNESDIRVCTNVSRRHQRDFGRTIGPLTDTLIVRTHLPRRSAPIDAIRRVRASLVESFQFLDVPFEEMATRLTAEHGIDRQTLAQVFFLLHEADRTAQPPSSDADEPDVTLGQDFFSSALHGYDMILYVERIGHGVRAQLTLKGGGPDAYASLAEEYLALLRELVSDCEAHLCS